ncbi:nitroreductase family protein [Gemella bergeri ATCC 700627]|uniref:Nitroreductase family protein n=1 Tax=Gemella bergeri ATCC 700627 TaxID=1321820 RepID=U2SAI5_9BACL|nr:nitroreductase family protein [Gemella bergeri]ERK59792.1 nitroreductase family protein [Gemella bergeri ATCC 700627]
MTQEKLYQTRRSNYALGKNLPISEEKVLEIIKNAIKYSPSAINSQTAHAVVLLGDNHDKLWNITFNELSKILPNEDAKKTTKDKLDTFSAAYGTILFFEDHDIVKGLQEQFPTYADNFPLWSEQSTGIASFAVWNALSEAGVGANIQHYNPLIDDAVAKEWDIPTNMVLRAQMLFGEITAPAAPIERTDRTRIIK